jgi:pyridoxine 4-dehydrogenase
MRMLGDREIARDLLRRAVELGVDFIDTADSYGDGLSEEWIAYALQPYPGDLVVATKAGRAQDASGEWRADCSPGHLREACEGSLRRLGLDTIDLFQLHVIDPEVPFDESAGALAELRAEGKIRHVGLSNAGPEHLARAREIVPIVSVQNRYSLTVRHYDPLIADCEQAGVAFIPWGPLDAGDLGAADGALAEVARAHETTTVQVALAWLLARSPAILLIPGTASIAHLEENVAAATLRLTEEEMASLAAAPHGV